MPLYIGLVGGSSPRVRGTVKIDKRTILTIRFIPACAGNGQDMAVHIGFGKVHPRVCGERVSG